MCRRRALPSRGNKGPEVGIILACARHSKKATVAGAESMKGKEGEDVARRIDRGLIVLVSMGQREEFGFYFRCLGKSLEGFKPGSDVI